MKDPLEQFIREHKDELDVFSPDERIWEKIDAEINPPETIPLIRQTRFVWAASLAAAICLLVASVMILPKLMKEEAAEGSMPIAQQNEINYREHYPAQLSEAETYYMKMIETQQQQVVMFKEMGIEGDAAFDQQMKQLNGMYQELRRELVYGQDPERVMEAMLQNLMMQMELLQQQLMILKQIKEVKDEQDGQINL